MIKPAVTLALVVAALLLTGCSRPETPQSVTESFWQAVIAGDAEQAAELSTLVNEGAYDAFERDWQAATVTYGRVVIEGDTASVDIVVQGLPQAPADGLEATTHLVQVNQQWQVDYYRTGDSLSSGTGLQRFMGRLEALSKDLSQRFEQQSDQAAQDMEAMARELERLAQTANERLEILMDEYSQLLEETLEDLSRSMEEALKQHPDASAEDKRTLNQAVLELEQQRDQLRDADLQAVAEGSQVLAQTGQALDGLGQEFSAERQQWQQTLSRWHQRSSELLAQLQGDRQP
ncbi:MAG: hypothetical protein R3280_04620 [Marinobacter sp.]|uniref:hypothetical protein n=1 Tax=Marinobacter sp. TaxID=50741 RepID=UPI00299EF35B|nr:hypothetical protein [Marinobacter sp.]MDX1633896.1 hypothetical protein [Marinobacter sp.]